MTILKDYNPTILRLKREVTPLEEAAIFDFLTHQVRNKDVCKRIGVTSATLHTLVNIAVRKWFSDGLITPGRIENDIKRRLAAQQKETNS